MTIISIDHGYFVDISDALTQISNDYNTSIKKGWEAFDKLQIAIDQFGGKDRDAVIEIYELVSQQIGLSVKTCINYVSAVRSFPPERRIEGLAINHHVAVLGLPDGVKEELLDRAVATGMSQEAIRYEARALRPNFNPVDRIETSNNTHYKTYDSLIDDSVDESQYDFDKPREQRYTIIDEFGIEQTVIVGADEELKVVSVDHDDTPELTYFDGSSISKPHVAQNSGNNEWYTPLEYIEAARSVLGTIDLDPASNPAANEVVGASTYYSAQDDGLQHEWRGRVWMNPPYAKDMIGQFVEKLYDHYQAEDISAAIVLVNNATETEWFQQLAEIATTICFPRRRVRFWSPDRENASPLQGQAILYMGQNSERFIESFSQFGIVAMKVFTNG